jgi:hypothetical protein
MKETRPSQHWPGKTVTLVIALLAAVTLAGCASSGSSHPASAGTNKSDTAAIAYAKCMRSHGIPDFPDPGSARPSGLDTGSPRYVAAYNTCKSLRNSSNSTSP